MGYIPLLRSFEALESDDVSFAVAIAFSPVLAGMLSDPLLQARYEAHLKVSIEFAEKILLEKSFSRARLKTLERHHDFLRKNQAYFAEDCQKNILKKIDHFARRGFVELLATPATPCFFPFYQDIPEAINAQIETGLMAHRANFDSIPDGFWLPALGWFPGLEKRLKAYGFRYSIVENTALLFSKTPPPAGVFAPAACKNGFAVFPRDSFALAEIAGEEGGFCRNPVYLDTDRDIGFTLDAETLKPLFDASLGRRVTGFRFFSQGAASKSAAFAKGIQAEDEGLYDPDIAARQAEADAKAFLEKSCEMLKIASGLLEGATVSRTVAFPASLLGGEWLEGVGWLEKAFRLAATMEDFSFATPASLLKRSSAEKEREQPVSPVFSSWLDRGYADEILNSANDWTYPYLKKATARMVDIAGRFPIDRVLSERILNAAAREVLLAQSIDWPVLMNDPVTYDYARARFEGSIKAFTTVYDSLGSNNVSTEWLTEMERKNTLFPFMNYHVFCRRR